jgi:hypothetical protein
VRAFDMALTALALRASATRPPKHERRLVPAIDDADAAMLDRDALNQQRAALIASLWPEGRPCLVPALYLQLPAPALFGAAFCVSWEWRENDAHASRASLPRAAGELQVAWAA